ncbi:unnamed protein product [Nippostrongylus brasiliensis]|uniref:Uncharacterized protein n=1 Tax=Nippostrongylus brasiliensis TaxID=27835 RepID=A0A0N4YRF4_NIPBR|nr:unnamed protein product [Nippostrongylus brasiliensis]
MSIGTNYTEAKTGESGAKSASHEENPVGDDDGRRKTILVPRVSWREDQREKRPTDGGPTDGRTLRFIIGGLLMLQRKVKLTPAVGSAEREKPGPNRPSLAEECVSGFRKKLTLHMRLAVKNRRFCFGWATADPVSISIHPILGSLPQS